MTKKPILYTLGTLIIILTSLYLMNGFKTHGYLNTTSSFNNLDTSICTANLTSDGKNLIKLGGADNYFVFEVKNPNNNFKKVSCWLDLYEDGNLKTPYGKMTLSLLDGDKPKYISIATNKISNDATKREFISTIITNNGMSQGRTIDEIDSSLSEASMANNEQKVTEGQTIDLAVFVQNQGSVMLSTPIANNLKELLKNKKVYIFRCSFDK